MSVIRKTAQMLTLAYTIGEVFVHAYRCQRATEEHEMVATRRRVEAELRMERTRQMMSEDVAIAVPCCHVCGEAHSCMLFGVPCPKCDDDRKSADDELRRMMKGE